MSSLPLSPDAAFVYGLASTALPFAESPDEEVERWIRLLRLHGESATVLTALGIGEERLVRVDAPAGSTPDLSPSEAMDAVGESAAEFAAGRGASSVGTLDLLVGVMRRRPQPFARALECRGSDTAELTDAVARHLHVALS